MKLTGSEDSVKLFVLISMRKETMSIKLVAIDLDDTLLDSGLSISPRCAADIEKCARRGFWSPWLPRMYRSALPYALQLGMNIPLITYQGLW